MAGGGYRGILAAVPTAQNLPSASRGGEHRHSIRGGLRADLVVAVRIPCRSELARDGRQRWHGKPDTPRRPGIHREQARSYRKARIPRIRSARRPPRLAF